MKAIGEQSMIGSPGRLGQATGKTSQSIEYVLTYVGRYNKPEQYENIILRANPDGEILRLKDVAKVELGSRVLRHLLGHRRPPLGRHRAQADPRHPTPPPSSRRSRSKLEEIKAESFPPGMDYAVTYDVSSFLDASIEKVLHTLLEAFVLVALVVFLFLGRLAVHADPDPGGSGVAGRDLLLHAVVRPVDQPDHAVRAGAGDRRRGRRRDRRGRGGARQDGTRSTCRPTGRPWRSCSEISGAIIAITLVMTAVFVPVTFMTGPVGDLLPPVRHHDGHVHRPLRRRGPDAHAGPLRDDPQAPHGTARSGAAPLWPCFLRRCSTAASRRSRAATPGVLRRIVTLRLITMLVIVGVRRRHLLREHEAPAGLHPDRRPGHDLRDHPDAAGLDPRVHQRQVPRAAGDRQERSTASTSVSSLAGYEVLTEGRGSNAGTCLINLKPWSERKQTVAADHRGARGKVRRTIGAT